MSIHFTSLRLVSLLSNDPLNYSTHGRPWLWHFNICRFSLIFFTQDSLEHLTKLKRERKIFHFSAPSRGKREKKRAKRRNGNKNNPHNSMHAASSCECYYMAERERERERKEQHTHNSLCKREPQQPFYLLFLILHTHTIAAQSTGRVNVLKNILRNFIAYRRMRKHVNMSLIIFEEIMECFIWVNLESQFNLNSKWPLNASFL